MCSLHGKASWDVLGIFSSCWGTELSWLKIGRRCSVLTEPSLAINYPSGWLKCIISICLLWLSAYERHCQVPNKYRVVNIRAELHLSYITVSAGIGPKLFHLSSILPPAVVRLISQRDSQISQMLIECCCAPWSLHCQRWMVRKVILNKFVSGMHPSPS